MEGFDKLVTIHYGEQLLYVADTVQGNSLLMEDESAKKLMQADAIMIKGIAKNLIEMANDPTAAERFYNDRLGRRGEQN